MVAGPPRGGRTGSGLQAGSSHARRPLALFLGGGVSCERCIRKLLLLFPRRRADDRFARANGVAATVVVVLGSAIAGAVALASSRSVVFDGAPTRTGLDDGWSMQSSLGVDAPPEAVSRPGFSTKGWFPVTLPSTVLGGLVADHEYPNLYVGTNLQNVWEPRFQVPWWYRTEFALDDVPGARTQLHFDGINYRADVYLNGTLVAGSDRSPARSGRTRSTSPTWSTRGRTRSRFGSIRSTPGTTSRSRGSTGARSLPITAWGSGTTSG